MSSLTDLMCICACVLSHVQPFVVPSTVAHEAPLSMKFSRPEYWRRLLFPPAGDLPDPGIESVSPVSCTGRWIHYRLCHQGSPTEQINI